VVENEDAGSSPESVAASFPEVTVAEALDEGADLVTESTDTVMEPDSCPEQEFSEIGLLGDLEEEKDGNGDKWIEEGATESGNANDSSLDHDKIPLQLDDAPDVWEEFPSFSGLSRLENESEAVSAELIEGLSGELLQDEPRLILQLAKDEPVEAVAEAVEDPMDYFQIYYHCGEGYSETASVVEAYDALSTQVIEMHVWAQGPIVSLRLDPARRPGRLWLKRIEVWNSDTHLPVYGSSEENAFDNIEPIGDIEVEGIEGDCLVLASLGDDPQIHLQLEASGFERAMVSVEFQFEPAKA
jgi:hypothetical protein